MLCSKVNLAQTFAQANDACNLKKCESFYK